MSLKFRLALLYSLSVFIILVASAFTIYLLAEKSRKEEFAKRLVIEASDSYQFYLSMTQSGADIEQRSGENFLNSTSGTGIFIYDNSGKLLYKSRQENIPQIPAQTFANSKGKEPYTFSNYDEEAVLLVRDVKGRNFYIVAAGIDTMGQEKNGKLKLILICAIIGGIILSGFLAYLYVNHAVEPLEELKAQMEKINEENLKFRITPQKGNDEIWQIAKKFNAMLDRLELAFEQRKNFVQHASHELRTPLANMLSQTEAALDQDLTTNDYRKVLLSLKEDQQDLIDLTNSLLILSRYEKLDELTDATQLRMDELIYQTVDYINESWPATLVTIDFESIPENEDVLIFTGNEALIRSALKNLVKNAVVFSEDLRVKISIDPGPENIILKFDNTGKQLSSEEQSRLFIPFFRGENAQTKKGHGLGLSMVERIVKVHKGKLTYQALPNNINRFTVLFPTA